MSRKSWDGVELMAALRSGAERLESRVAEVNALNVFPVPDGDTGTNMLATLKAAIAEGEATLAAGVTAIDAAACATTGAAAVRAARPATPHPCRRTPLSRHARTLRGERAQAGAPRPRVGRAMRRRRDPFAAADPLSSFPRLQASPNSTAGSRSGTPSSTSPCWARVCPRSTTCTW